MCSRNRRMGERHKKWQIHTFLHKYTIYDAEKNGTFWTIALRGHGMQKFFFYQKTCNYLSPFYTSFTEWIVEEYTVHLMSWWSIRFDSSWNVSLKTVKKRCHTVWVSHCKLTSLVQIKRMDKKHWVSLKSMRIPTTHIQMITTNRTSYYGLVSAEKRISTLKSLRWSEKLFSWRKKVIIHQIKVVWRRFMDAKLVFNEEVTQEYGALKNSICLKKIFCNEKWSNSENICKGNGVAKEHASKKLIHDKRGQPLPLPVVSFRLHALAIIICTHVFIDRLASSFGVGCHVFSVASVLIYFSWVQYKNTLQSIVFSFVTKIFRIRAWWWNENANNSKCPCTNQ